MLGLDPGEISRLQANQGSSVVVMWAETMVAATAGFMLGQGYFGYVLLSAAPVEGDEFV